MDIQIELIDNTIKATVTAASGNYASYSEDLPMVSVLAGDNIRGVVAATNLAISGAMGLLKAAEGDA